MKLAAAAIVASLACAACSTAVPAQPPSIALDKVFSLKVGEAALWPADGLRIGFDSVTGDSRCPKGEQCVWAGDATVRVWAQQGAGPRAVHALHLAQGKAQAVRVLKYELRLVKLDPHPISRQVIAPANYVATLMLSSKPEGDSDR